jgi:hypothetical protein
VTNEQQSAEDYLPLAGRLIFLRQTPQEAKRKAETDSAWEERYKKERAL